MQTEINSLIVKKYGTDAGASVVGVAAARDFGLAPEGFRPSDNLEGCRSVIVLGVPFPREALDANAFEYTEMRNAIVSKMTDMAKKVAKRINADGHKAKAISATGGKYINGKQFGHISLKHAAELAGIGVITRNYLLTNPQNGNILWFSAVLTDVELVPDEKARSEICDGCNICVEACPSGALDNPELFGKGECSGFCWKQVDRKWLLNCFLCRKVCPCRFGMN